VVAAGAVALVAAALFATAPALASVPARLGTGCSRWVAVAAVLELLSAAGFVVAFKLSFADGSPWRASSHIALRMLGAATALPAGAVLAPALGARITRTGPGRVAARALAFVLLTNAPDIAAVAAVGIALRLGLLAGPRAAGLTLVPAAGALAVLAGVGVLTRVPLSRKARRRRVLRCAPIRAAGALRDGVREAQGLLRAGGWKLIGPVAYYVFDNAVLWAGFRALGHSPPLGTLVMAYVVGQAGSLLPLPGGLGAVEATMIGALAVYGIAVGPAAAAVLIYRAVSLTVPLALGVTAYILPPRSLVLPSATSGPNSELGCAGRPA
jgi:uncharacterized membrane protein YbhN (UPF0104 family)